MSLIEIAVLVLLVAILMQVYILDERVKRLNVKIDNTLNDVDNCETCKVAKVCECKDIKEEQ